MNTNEPVRITNIYVAILVIILEGIMVYLQTEDWKTTLLVQIPIIIGFLTAGEISRNKVVGPATFKAETGKDISQL